MIDADRRITNANSSDKPTNLLHKDILVARDLIVSGLSFLLGLYLIVVRRLMKLNRSLGEQEGGHVKDCVYNVLFWILRRRYRTICTYY